jgi:hypothetical protein
MTKTQFYKRPTVFRRRVYDPLMRLLILRFGFGGILDRNGADTVQVLCVRGRRTGAWHRRPVGVGVYHGERHLVGFYGQTEWARNLRAGSEARLQTRKRVEPVTASEILGEEKADFMRNLVARYHFFARAWLKVNPKRLTAADLDRLVADYPVFRVRTRA